MWGQISSALVKADMITEDGLCQSFSVEIDPPGGHGPVVVYQTQVLPPTMSGNDTKGYILVRASA